jgi:hypothetical protein
MSIDLAHLDESTVTNRNPAADAEIEEEKLITDTETGIESGRETRDSVSVKFPNLRALRKQQAL